MIKRNTGVAVAGDVVVAAASLELVGRGSAAVDAGTSRIGADSGEARRVINIREFGSPDRLYRCQRIGPDIRAARNRACRKLHVNAGTGICHVVTRAIETAAAIDRVVTAQSLEVLG